MVQRRLDLYGLAVGSVQTVVSATLGAVSLARNHLGLHVRLILLLSDLQALESLESKFMRERGSVQGREFSNAIRLRTPKISGMERLKH